MSPPNSSENFNNRDLVKLTVIDPSFPNFTGNLKICHWHLKGISSPYF